MDRTTDEIEQRIDRDRERLRSNLEELEDRVRSVTDWRRHYRGNPALWMGLAFGGGLLLAFAASRDEPAADLRYPAVGSAAARAGSLGAGYTGHRQREISRAWRTIESALIGLAAAKLKHTLAQVLPGFREQLARHEGNGYARGHSERDHSQHY